MNLRHLSRREALRQTSIAIGAAVLTETVGRAGGVGESGAPTPRKGTFRYCLNTATIRGQKLGILKEAEIAAKAGYEGIEPWVESVDTYSKNGGSLADLKNQIS